jgi:hypothetical protein
LALPLPLLLVVGYHLRVPLLLVVLLLVLLLVLV